MGGGSWPSLGLPQGLRVWGSAGLGVATRQRLWASGLNVWNFAHLALDSEFYPLFTVPLLGLFLDLGISRDAGGVRFLISAHFCLVLKGAWSGHDTIVA